ncbi:hypothetical protein [Alkalimarinus sediminis]|uniref:Uncharacterized protein n=1 Tax=Alkalimarinus sediminis TaxID=1632866 RepID=A0A9E8KMQ3_9ALTE|nr:hypothetical protein [Alkalimarinus sediminis]UZW73658.1 hypothetical protein NNL22_11475 [Alkalimarinus sediminis]
MKYLALLLFFIPSAYADNHADSTDESLLQAKEYCHSMVQDGTPSDEATEFVNQCMAEQRSYIEEAREASQPDCYQQVDDAIQEKLDNDPNSSYEYDQLLDNCLNETNLD